MLGGTHGDGLAGTPISVTVGLGLSAASAVAGGHAPCGQDDALTTDSIQAGVNETFSRWLWSHSDELVAAIDDAVAKRTAIP